MNHINSRSILKSMAIILGFVLSLEVGFMSYFVINDNGNSQRNLNLGNKYLLDMNYEEAIKAFSKALEIDKMNADAYVGRGDAYLSLGDFKSAWDDYEKAQDLSGDSTILDTKIGQSELRVISSSGAIPNASISLSGETHSYELKSDEEGLLQQTLYPENYRVTVNKENYHPVETEISAESGGAKMNDIFMELALIPFSYDALNEFVNGGYASVITYQPEGYALVDINKDDTPELVLSFKTQYSDVFDTWMGNYEVFRYDEVDGQFKSAGNLTETRLFYSIFYSEPYSGLFVYDRTSGSHIDYVYEFDGEHMNWSFNSMWERAKTSPYEYEVSYEDINGRVSKGIYPSGQHIEVYNEIAPPVTLELNMIGFNNSEEYHLSESDVQNFAW